MTAPTTTIRMWRGFASNNSTNYRLVARFADAATSAAAADEVRAILATDRDEIAARYGIAWDDLLADGSAHDNPDDTEIAQIDRVLVAYHDYCLGYGPAMAPLVEARGGTVTAQRAGTPNVSVRFAYAGGNPRLDDELDALFTAIARGGDTEPYVALALPWGEREHWGWTAAGYRDARSVGLYVPAVPDDLAALRTWLVDHALADHVLQLCEDGDADKFAAIARARCTACDGALVFLDPRLPGLADPGETEQLACYGCGGLYELATYMPPAIS